MVMVKRGAIDLPFLGVFLAVTARILGKEMVLVNLSYNHLSRWYISLSLCNYTKHPSSSNHYMILGPTKEKEFFKKSILLR